MKTVILLALLMSMSIAQDTSSYTLPDFGVDRTEITCENYEELTTVTQSDKSRLDGIVSKIPANIQTVDEVETEVNLACGLVENLRDPFQTNLVQMKSKARNQLAHTFKKSTQKVHNAVKKADPFDQIFNDKLDKITTEFEQLTAQGSINFEAIKSKCEEVSAAVTDLSAYLSWAQTEIQNQVIDGFLVPRLEELSAMTEQCNVEVKQIRAGYFGPGGQKYHESAVDEDYGIDLSTITVYQSKDSGLVGIVFKFSNGNVKYIGADGDKKYECQVEGRKIKELIVGYQDWRLTFFKAQFNSAGSNGQSVCSMGTESGSSLSSLVIGEKYKLAGVYGNYYASDIQQRKYNITGIGFFLNTVDDATEIAVERTESAMYGTKHSGSGFTTFYDNPAKNILNAPEEFLYREGGYIDSVQLGIWDGENYFKTTKRGSMSGNAGSVYFPEWGRLTGINVRAGGYIDGMELLFEGEVSGAHVGGYGGTKYTVSIRPDTTLVGFKGQYAISVSQIGFIFDRYDVSSNNNRLRW